MIWFPCIYRKIRKTGFDFLKQVYILREIYSANLKMWSMERVKQFCKNKSWAKKHGGGAAQREGCHWHQQKGDKLDCNSINLQIGRNPWTGVLWGWGTAPRLCWDKQMQRRVSLAPQRGLLWQLWLHSPFGTPQQTLELICGRCCLSASESWALPQQCSWSWLRKALQNARDRF